MLGIIKSKVGSITKIEEPERIHQKKDLLNDRVLKYCNENMKAFLGYKTLSEFKLASSKK